MGKKFLLCAAAVVGVIAISPDLQKELKDKSQQVYWMIMENIPKIKIYEKYTKIMVGKHVCYDSFAVAPLVGAWI